MPTDNSKNGGNNLVINYLTLRKTIGFLGIFLPVLLPLGVFTCAQILSETGTGALQCSISDYYHTHMRTLFTGTICVLSVFLFAYNGYDRRDRIAGLLAGVFGLCTAFIHNIAKTVNCEPCELPKIQSTMNWIHLASAALFFLTLAWFSIFLFTESNQPKANQTPNKKKRNLIYKICGWIMVACILFAGIVILCKPVKAALIEYKPVFWLETISLWAFGFSWLIKGEFLLKD